MMKAMSHISPDPKEVPNFAELSREAMQKLALEVGISIDGLTDEIQ